MGSGESTLSHFIPEASLKIANGDLKVCSKKDKPGKSLILDLMHNSLDFRTGPMMAASLCSQDLFLRALLLFALSLLIPLSRKVAFFRCNASTAIAAPSVHRLYVTNGTSWDVTIVLRAVLLKGAEKGVKPSAEIHGKGVIATVSPPGVVWWNHTVVELGSYIECAASIPRHTTPFACALNALSHSH